VQSEAPTSTGTASSDVAAGGDVDSGIPEQVDRFVVEKQLGAGGMGRVYLAHDPDLDRKVAIKLLREEPGLDVEKAHARMAREARAMARLRHPNVVVVYEVGTHEGRVFIVMEYVEGGTLRDWVEAGGARLGWAPIVARYVAAGRGLEAAHAAGLVHRDFKPDNVLVERGSSRVLVTDFGIASAYGDEPAPASSDGPAQPGLTRTGVAIGTPPYMSPEQHLAHPVDARTDQFAFCVALYEALFGIRPFGGETIAEITSNVVLGQITPPRIDRGTPAWLAEAVRRGLRQERADRFPSMTALLAELAVVRRPRRWIAPAAGAAAIALGAAAWVGVRGRPGPGSVADCDCELFTMKVPPGARVVGFSPIPAGPAARVASAGPTLAVPRGRYTVDYEAGGVRYSYAVVSAGAGAARTLALPAPEPRDGYAFVPGGEVPIGDLAGDGVPEERPISTVHLEPYLIAIREEPALLAYDPALDRAREAHARLPTAAEWEWAARLGVLEHALANQWEWTATQFAPYPYDAVRDDPLAKGATVEVRGGQVGDCDESGDRRATACASAPDDRARVSRRFEGRRAGAAELRLVRAPAGAPVARELRVELVGGELESHELARLHRFLWDWSAGARPRALLIAARTQVSCTFMGALEGIDTHEVEIVLDPALPESQIVLRAHPDPDYRNERGRVVCGATSIEILDPLCFDGDRLLRSSDRIIASLATTLAGNPSIRKVEIGVYVANGTADPLRASQRRAEVVRARLISEGVAAERLVARGHGAEGERGESAQRQRDILLSNGGTCASGGRVETTILERSEASAGSH